jgi:hypothetical protein
MVGSRPSTGTTLDAVAAPVWRRGLRAATAAVAAPALLAALAACNDSSSAVPLPPLASISPAVAPPVLRVPYPLYCDAHRCTASVSVLNPSDLPIPLSASVLRATDPLGHDLGLTLDGAVPPEIAARGTALVTIDLPRPASLVGLQLRLTVVTGRTIAPLAVTDATEGGTPSPTATPAAPSPTAPVRAPVHLAPVRPVRPAGPTQGPTGSNPGAGSGSIG